MPSLSILKRPTIFGGDDLYPALAAFLCFHSTLLLTSVLVSVRVASTASLTAANFLLAFWCISAQHRGTPTQNQGRDLQLEKALLVKLSVVLPATLAFNAVGFAFIGSASNFAGTLALLVCQAAEALSFLLVACWALYSWLCHGRGLQDRDGDDGAAADAVPDDRRWEKRCRLLCKLSPLFTCNVFGGVDPSHSDLTAVSHLLSDYFFHGDQLDVVPSDVAAGLTCLRHVQKGEAEERRRGSSPTASRSSFERRKLDKDNHDDFKALEEAARFSRYALSVYTWMLYSYMFPLSSPWALCASLCGLNCRRKRRRAAPGDVCCGLHTAGFLLHSGLKLDDIVYSQYKNDIGMSPYCILLDREWKSVVIVVRGTLSLSDCVTDALAEPVEIAEAGRKWGFDGEGEWAHKGILSTAEWIRMDLEEHGLLDKLMLGDSARFKNYQLKITGHSLGAGCAALLSLMLSSKFPSLRCLAFSPPGSLTSLSMSRRMSSFTTSYVLNADLVPRLSFLSMEKMRGDVLRLICRIKVSKIRVLKTAVALNGKNRSQIIDDLLYEEEEVPDTDFKRRLERFDQVQDRVRTRRGRKDIRLYPPGRIMHFVKTSQSNPCCCRLLKCVCPTRTTYTAVWAELSDFEEILISPSMALDHFPDRVCSAIEATAGEWDIDARPGHRGRNSCSRSLEEMPLLDRTVVANEV